MNIIHLKNILFEHICKSFRNVYMYQPINEYLHLVDDPQFNNFHFSQNWDGQTA